MRIFFKRNFINYTKNELQGINILKLRGRSQLSTFMKAYTAYARGEGVWDHRTLFPENQHLFLITDNVL